MAHGEEVENGRPLYDTSSLPEGIEDDYVGIKVPDDRFPSASGPNLRYLLAGAQEEFGNLENLTIVFRQFGGMVNTVDGTMHVTVYQTGIAQQPNLAPEVVLNSRYYVEFSSMKYSISGQELASFFRGSLDFPSMQTYNAPADYFTGFPKGYAPLIKKQ